MRSDATFNRSWETAIGIAWDMFSDGPENGMRIYNAYDQDCHAVMDAGKKLVSE